MGNTNSVPSTSNRQLPKIKFRVLIIGRANAGKTSILQRVCDTTDSPVVYQGDEEVRNLTFMAQQIRSYSLLGST
jgi:GTPase SAR1 family protein